MLSRVMIDGYKSIDRLELELQNFTLLSGVNSAGKTSVIQAILYMMQTQKNYGKYNSTEEYADMGRFVDVRNSVKGNREILFELDTKIGEEVGTSRAHIYPTEDVTTTQFQMPSENRTENYGKNHNITYLSVERVGIQRAYDLNTKNLREIGRRGEYAYSYLATFGQDIIPEIRFAYRPEEIGMSLNNQVNYWLNYLIGFQIKTNIVADVDQVVVTYSNARDNRYYRAQNVGTGVTFISGLVIAALTCKVGDTLIIENPEIHLHPRAQSKFMEFLAYLTSAGLQVIIETHSDHIYNGMRICVKKGILKKEHVAAYFFELDETMQTKVCQVQLNEQGAEENHPYGMFDQFDDDLDELLDM